MTYKITFGTYEFPMPQNINDNFSNFVPATDRIFGMDGGFDNYGTDTGPQEIGNVSISFILSVYDTNGLQTLVDDLGKLAAYGKQELRKWPHGASATDFRFCMAKFNNISIGEDLSRGIEQLKRVITVNFQVDDPVWYKRPTNAAEWAYAGGADNLVWNTGGAQYWDGWRYSLSITNYFNSVSYGYLGTAPTPLMLTVFAGAGQSLSNPSIILLVAQKIVAEVRWNGRLNDGEALIIDSRRRQLILLSQTRAPDQEYNNFWTSSPDWLQILPDPSLSGALQIYTESSADRGGAYLTWLEAYYT